VVASIQIYPLPIYGAKVKYYFETGKFFLRDCNYALITLGANGWL
jgi:hypothetical protein